MFDPSGLNFLTQSPNPKRQYFVFFSNETKLKFPSLEPLIGLLAFVVGKLCQKFDNESVNSLGD